MHRADTKLEALCRCSRQTLDVMNEPLSDLTALLRSMEPELNDGVYVYSVVPANADLSGIPALAFFREAEGVTLITREAVALEARLPVLFRAAWITLKVHSDLHAIGLTAAFSRALGAAGISCNVVAGAHHDHIFVPVERAAEAMAELRALQSAP
jgi:hypothetical protein